MLVGLCAVIGSTHLAFTAPHQVALGFWPIGLVAGATLAAGRGRRVAVLPGVLAAVAASCLLADRPPTVALGYGLGVAAACWLTALVLERRPGAAGAADHTARPPLRSAADFGRFLRAVLAGTLSLSVIGVAAAAIADYGSAGEVGQSLFFNALASLLVVVPFFCDLPERPLLGRPAERIAQRVTLVMMTVAVFTVPQVPLVVVLVIPVLAWGALRVTAREALVQLLGVVGVGMTLSSVGIGPVGSVAADYGLYPDARVILLGMFGATCALVVVLLVLQVGQLVADEERIAAERDRVSRIVDGARGVAIIGADVEGRITLFNPGAERLLGYDAAEMMGRYSRVLHSDDAVRRACDELGIEHDFGELARALSSPGVGQHRMLFRRKDGTERVHLMTLSRLEDDRGRVSGYVSTSEDVTDLLAAQDRLEESLRAERAAVERLREVDEVKDAFVSSVSHELRTPITSMIGFLELLTDGSYGSMTSAQRYALERVFANSNRLLALIDDLLTLSRLQHPAAATPREVLDLRDAIGTARQLVAPAWAPPRRLRVVVELPPAPVPVLGEREALERVVVNLLGNAVKFTPDDGAVEVRLGVVAGRARLEVADTGIGVPAEEQHLMFSRFFRSSAAVRDAVPGTGLGLSISRAIVEKHGGEIGFAPREGGGTVFTVTLPLAPGTQREGGAGVGGNNEEEPSVEADTTDPDRSPDRPAT